VAATRFINPPQLSVNIQPQIQNTTSPILKKPQQLSHHDLKMLLLLLLFQVIQQVFCQYPPNSTNLTSILSPVDGNITISYKTPNPGTCATIFDTQQQFTGWVNVPGEYPTNTFFWFIAGRDPTDQLTIWLNGGPGSSSMIGLFTENGPCEAVEISNGVIGTVAREWGWDRGSNMLYIDQVCMIT